MIEFEGKVIKPNSKGVWHCPFDCGDPRFSRPKWKTKKGFLGHLAKCTKRPSAVQARQIEKAKKEEREKIKKKELEIKRERAIAEAPHKIGDTIYYVYCEVIKPTHERKFNRMVRVRYNEVLKYTACSTTVKGIDYDGLLRYNGEISQADIFPTMEEAKEHAKIRQREHEEHLQNVDLCS